MTAACDNITDTAAQTQCEELAATGAGTGAMLDGLGDPLGRFLLKVAIIGVVVVLLGGITAGIVFALKRIFSQVRVKA